MSTSLRLPTFEALRLMASRAVRARPLEPETTPLFPVRHQALGSACGLSFRCRGRACQELRHLAGEEDRILFTIRQGFAMRRFGWSEGPTPQKVAA